MDKVDIKVFQKVLLCCGEKLMNQAIHHKDFKHKDDVFNLFKELNETK